MEASLLNLFLTAFLTAVYGVLPFWTTWPILDRLFIAAHAQSALLTEAGATPLVLTWVLAFALASLTVGLLAMAVDLAAALLRSARGC